MILFSIIVPTYERTDVLRKCLLCIKNGKQFEMNCTSKEANYEIIVTDDGQNNDTQFLISKQFKYIKWIKGPNKGPAANRNRGAKEAKGKWLIFTDDDCLPDYRWLSTFHKAIIKYPESKAFEGAIKPVGNINAELAHCPVNLHGGCFWSANIAIETKLFNSLGGFDENYPMAANEDQDLHIRISKKTKVRFISNAVVKHPVVIHSILDVLKVLPKRNKSWAYHCKKHHEYLKIQQRFMPIVYSIKNQIKYIYINLKSYHFKELLTVILGFPINMIFLSYYLIRNKKRH